MNGFWRDFWISFKAVHGPILAVAAFVLALLGPAYAPTAPLTINAVWVAIVAIVGAIILLTLVNLVGDARRRVLHRLPRTLDALVDARQAGTGHSAVVTLLLDRSELFGFNLVVAIYYNETLNSGKSPSVERLIGAGRVSNVQENGLIQISVLVEVPAHADLWQRVRNRDMTTITNIVVKSSIPYDLLGYG